MPVVNGFELLRKLPNLQARVIFTTAYDQYALKAFRFNAVDYLLKPIDKSELIEAVSRVQKHLTYHKPSHFFIRTSKWTKPKKILLPIGNELVLSMWIRLSVVKPKEVIVKYIAKVKVSPIFYPKSEGHRRDDLVIPLFQASCIVAHQ